jgi:hypothetical protein
VVEISATNFSTNITQKLSTAFEETATAAANITEPEPSEPTV